jgi:hypothetical protein
MPEYELYSCTDCTLLESLRSCPSMSELNQNSTCFWLGSVATKSTDASAFLTDAEKGCVDGLLAKSFFGVGDILLALLVPDASRPDRFHVVVILQPDSMDLSPRCVLQTLVEQPLRVTEKKRPTDPDGQIGEDTSWWNLMIRTFLPRKKN